MFTLGHRWALCATAAAFSFCAFPSIADDTNIVGLLAQVVNANSAEKVFLVACYPECSTSPVEGIIA